MIGPHTTEAVASLTTHLSQWECVKIKQDSATYINSPDLHKILGSEDDLIAFYRVKSLKCFLFRIYEGQLTPLPTLYLLEMSLKLIEPIEDVAVLQNIAALAAASGKFTEPYWELK